MGTYISKPITQKDSCDDDYKHLKCGASSMQGWRVSQEDAHNAILNFDDGAAFFGVYDGHGGHEVAEFVAKYFPEHLLKNELYKKGEFEQALIDSFLEFDAKMLSAESLAELKQIATTKKDAADNDSTDSEEAEEIDALRREAAMPIDELIASNYPDPAKVHENVGKVFSPNLRPKRGLSSKSKAPALDLNGEDQENEDEEITCGVSSSVNISGASSDKSEENSTAKVKSEENSNSSSDKELTNGTMVLGEPTKKEESQQSPTKNSNEDEVSERVNGEIQSEEALSNEKKNGNVSEPADDEAKVITEESESLGYIGKGKSGGKGGKVKGKSAITTTKLETKPTPAKQTRSKTSSVEETKKTILSDEDLDSEEDEEEEQDATFAPEAELEDEEDSPAAEDEENLECEEDEEEEDDDYEDEEDSADDAEICHEFHSKMSSEPGFSSGCTACVALLHQHTLYVANVGDSRCVVSRSGKAIEMSLDHKPEDDIETQRIEKAGGKVTKDGRVNGGLNLSRALGDHGYKQNSVLLPAEQMISPLPDIKSLPLRQDDDFVIIACDGIWNSLSSQEAVDFVQKHLRENPEGTLSGACEAMFDYCLAPDLHGDGTGCDNMTCIIVSFKDKTLFASAEAEDATQHLQTELKTLNGVESHNSTSNGNTAVSLAPHSTSNIVCSNRREDSLDTDADTAEDDRPAKRAKLE